LTFPKATTKLSGRGLSGRRAQWTMAETVDGLDRVAKDYEVFVASDGAGFKPRARILQSVWRKDQGYPMGKHRGRPLESRLPMPWAKETLGIA
jgi:hypothetical protein